MCGLIFLIKHGGNGPKDAPQLVAVFFLGFKPAVTYKYLTSKHKSTDGSSCISVWICIQLVHVPGLRRRGENGWRCFVFLHGESCVWGMERGGEGGG